MDKPVNTYELTDRITTSGQPTAAHIHAIADNGFEVLVNLAMHDSENALETEGSLAASLGMNYVNIPVPFDEPDETHLREFVGIMETFSEKKVWVHCAVNARVSAFMYQYLTQVKGWNADDATTPLMTKWRPKMDDAWQEFMDIEL